MAQDSTPAKGRRERVIVYLDASDVEALDAAQGAAAVPPTRSALVRAAVRRGLPLLVQPTEEPAAPAA